MRRLGCLITTLVLGAGNAQQVVRHPEAGLPQGRNVYQIELLRAALEVTRDEYGDYVLAPVPEMPQEREMRSLLERRLHDVVWTVTSEQREQMLLPVRFPLLKGLLGHRVCLIRSDDPLFSDPPLPRREQLVLGSGVSWPDTATLKANDFLVETSSEYASILKMLRARRLNCFPRGLNEVDIELAAYGTPEVRIDERLAFLYLSPMYFFVAPEDEALADRLYKGLTLMHQSGALDTLFESHFDTEDLLESHQMQERAPFCLHNPALDQAEVAALAPFLVTGPGTYVDECVDLVPPSTD